MVGGGASVVVPGVAGAAFKYDGSAMTKCATRWSDAFLDCTFFGVFRVTTAVAWSAILFDRSGVNGGTFGSDGLKFHYVWDGSEWAYSTGLTFALGELVAFAYSVRAGSVTIALNGKMNKRTGISNSARTIRYDTQMGAAAWIGGDSQGGRNFKGEIYLAGICLGAWTDEALLDFSRNPWQIFPPRRIHVPYYPAVAGGLPTLSAATYMPGSLTSSGFRPRVTAS